MDLRYLKRKKKKNPREPWRLIEMGEEEEDEEVRIGVERWMMRRNKKKRNGQSKREREREE